MCHCRWAAECSKYYMREQKKALLMTAIASLSQCVSISLQQTAQGSLLAVYNVEHVQTAGIWPSYALLVLPLT